jgi:D-arabinose 1-dehydrogenase-like Zn-dependent alcohol dehydrogenase
MSSGPLELTDRPVPEPGPAELLVRVIACGVCRTDLHLAEGDLPPHHPRMTPGHEVVGQVTATGPGTTRFREGDRVGAAWLRLKIKVTTTPCPFGRADQVLTDLEAERVHGAAVLQM